MRLQQEGGTFLLEQAVTEELSMVEDTASTETMIQDGIQTEVQTEILEEAALLVHICGAVKEPGVYEVPKESRVRDVIEAAGGLTEEAAGDYINQAQPVSDGSKIVIPTYFDVEETTLYEDVRQSKEEADTGKININRATKEQLCRITGVGESRAQSIMDYRETHGEFKSIEDIMKVDGIKSGMFEKIKELITVD